jgi:uncharacterized protein (TIGR03067 family)
MLCVGLLSSFLLIAAAQEPCPTPGDTTKADTKSMQGNWKVEKIETGGTADASKVGTQMTIKDDVLTIKDGKRDEVATFKLDGKKKPKEITISPKRDNTGVAGIYKLEKDTLTICFAKGGGPRPKSFTTKDTKNTVIVFKREKS